MMQINQGKNKKAENTFNPQFLEMDLETFAEDNLEFLWD